jgi:hypothetical protein
MYIFTKNHEDYGRKFKKGMYLKVPDVACSGQWRVYQFWEWVKTLIKKKVIKKV